MSDLIERARAWKEANDYPLTVHRSGRYAKKVRGSLLWMGKVTEDIEGSAAAALNKWLDGKDDWLAGRLPRESGAGVTVLKVCNEYLRAKGQAHAAGEIGERTLADCCQLTAIILKELGKNRLAADLQPRDFDNLKAKAAKRRAKSYGKIVAAAKAIFKYAYDAGLIENPMRFGPNFKPPSKKVQRIARSKAGSKMFEAADLRKLLDNARPQLRTMILLALNCGFGNSDCGQLPIEAIDLAGGWINFPRPKTGVGRRCPLWRETAAALKAVLAKRKQPADGGRYVFVTKYGTSWAKDTCDNPVTKEFAKLLKSLGMQQHGRNFYALRHVFRTVADGTRDQVACNHIMGHADSSMAGVYRESIEDSRLQAVTAHVRAWLFKKIPKGK